MLNLSELPSERNCQALAERPRAPAPPAVLMEVRAHGSDRRVLDPLRCRPGATHLRPVARYA
jgi:hypothetical protein